MQGMEAKLDEHKKFVIMFQQATEYNVHMTNILLRLFDMEIYNKQIIEEKDRSTWSFGERIEAQNKVAR